MRYKLNPIVEKIQSPIILHIGSSSEFVRRFSCGKEMADENFDKKYVIESISAVGDTIAITVVESREIFPSTWIGEEMVSFF